MRRKEKVVMSRSDVPGKGGVSEFIRHHFRHFNAAVVKDAAEAYIQLLEDGGSMFLAMAGAMSTAEIGLTLAEMIRRDKVHAICCTGANFEEDIFNLVAQKHYVRVPHYRDLTPEDEKELLEKGLNRVTDTCIPEEEAVRRIGGIVLEGWKSVDAAGQRRFPHEFLYSLLMEGRLEPLYQIDPQNSWVLAAAQKNLPIFIPGWEDSTLGNVFIAQVLKGVVRNPGVIRTGIEYMLQLVDWYRSVSAGRRIGFFQVGGGIAGDFPICVVPILKQDMAEDVPYWSYFCQISDSTTSYGSYSGAVPNEKITWGKLDVDSPRFIIESDASIVLPLVFSYVLESMDQAGCRSSERPNDR